jgi:predicted DNA-binding protein (UPF0251 family)
MKGSILVNGGLATDFERIARKEKGEAVNSLPLQSSGRVPRDQGFDLLKNGVTVWAAVEPLVIEFDILVLPDGYRLAPSGKPMESSELTPLTRAQFEARLTKLIEDEKLPFGDAAIRLGVSPTTVRRTCRTLKLGSYRDLKAGAVRALSSQAPFGWDLVQGELRRNPEEWEWVVEIRRMRMGGQSLRKIADYLRTQKVATKNGGQWHAKTVSQILKFNAPYLERASST